ncbi:MAG: flagellar basal body-associated protein FliL [Aeromonadaceae bacterium]|nr:flagellar basal body-associated protein FliL [Aeromonadaceae bacterium]
MADEKEPQLELKPARSKKTLIIIIVAVLLLVGGGVGGWLLLAGGEEAAPAAEQAASADGQAAPVVDAALYVGMPRAFVFNVAGKPRDRLVQIKVQLMVRGSDAEGLAKQHTPLIEGTLLRVFSAATVPQLSTVEGKDKLRQDSVEEVRRVLTELTGKPVVEQILFTGFVMQ